MKPNVPAMKVALFGVFGSDNFGNEASLVSATQSLRRRLPGVELLCICINPRRARLAYGLDALDLNLRRLGDSGGLRRLVLRCLGRARMLRILKAVQAYRHLRGLDALVFPGTGIFDDYLLEPGGQPLDMLIWCVLARLYRARVILVSVGAGPITNPCSLRLMTAAARMAGHRSFRDTASREFMGSHGIDVTRDRVLPDIVFGLQPENVGPSATDGNEGLLVGVGVMDYRGWKTGGTRQAEIYRKHVADTAGIIESILERGHRVRIILGESSDKTAAEDVLERVGAAGIAYGERCVAPPMSGFEDVFRELQQCHLVIGTRFHTVVSALMLGKPVISIGYAAKNRNLLKEFGLGQYAHDMGTLSVAQVTRQFDELVLRRADLRDGILRKAESYRSEVDAYMESLWDTLRATMR